jgi:hypothetical protein
VGCRALWLEAPSRPHLLAGVGPNGFSRLTISGKGNTMQTILNRLAAELGELATNSYIDMETRAVVGQITTRQWRIYRLFWAWSGPRYSGLASLNQDRLQKRRGLVALCRRRNQFRKALGLELIPDPSPSYIGAIPDDFRAGFAGEQ